MSVEPIYYAAGYKDGDAQQYPWNLSKLLAHILQHTKKRNALSLRKRLTKIKKFGKTMINLEITKRSTTKFY